MNEENQELSPEEELHQENFVLKSKIILKGGIMSEMSEMDPSIENMFLKNVMAFEEAEYKPVFEMIGINMDDFPKAETLSKEEIEKYLKEIIELLENNNMLFEINEGVPANISYKFLTEDYLLEESQVIPGFTMHIDGCSGDCPDCFQIDYCDTKNDIWPPEKLDAEIKRRAKEGLLD